MVKYDWKKLLTDYANAYSATRIFPVDWCAQHEVPYNSAKRQITIQAAQDFIKQAFENSLFAKARKSAVILAIMAFRNQQTQTTTAAKPPHLKRKGTAEIPMVALLRETPAIRGADKRISTR
ncbi:hypothetical protein [Pectobacterium aroidearum]|uniref:hypothetical protein n=1 Tax=Pectobacterium aroidearum TaxID=1201031 RepID=UPI0032EB37EB